MTICAWRIFKPKHAQLAFSGDGARLNGGRWNSPGVPVVYTAASVSLAALELLVHLQASEILDFYAVCPVRFDEELVTTISARILPPNWTADARREALREIGDRWVESGSSAVLCVPSAVIETEFNYLLNPAHEDFMQIKIGRRQKFRYDPRLLK